MKVLEKVSSFFSKHPYALLGLILLLGLGLRVFHLWNNVIFAYDQARDAQRIMGIISLHHFKLVGPETDIPGVFNGVLYYYILAPFYFLSRLNPNGVALMIAGINIAAGILIYYVTNVLFEKKSIALLATFFWAISFEQLAYARYISNASFMGIASLIFFVGCALYFLKNQDIGLVISAIGWGLGIHFNFYLIYLVIFYGVFYFLYPRKITSKSIGISVLVLLFILSPYPLSEIQRHFAGTKALLAYFNSQDSGGSLSVFDAISRYMEKLSEAVYYSFFSYNTFFSFLFLTFMVLFVYFSTKKRKSLYFLYVWIFSTLPLFAFESGVLTVPVINSSIQGAMVILMALGVYELFEQKNLQVLSIGIFVFITLSNLNLFVKNHFNTNSFFVKDGMTLGAEEKVMDYTYQQAAGKPFSICALTNPSLVNTVWGYDYSWYGKQKYGYVPYWAGAKQSIMESLLPYDTKHVSLRFIIEEPLIGITFAAPRGFIYLEDGISKLQAQKNFDGIIVQKRILQQGKTHFIDTQGLSDRDIHDLQVLLGNSLYLYSCYNTY